MKVAGLMRMLPLCVMVFVAGAAFAADGDDPEDLILRGDAQCTGCHDDADETRPTMLDLHPSVLSIGKTKHGTNADDRTPTCVNCHGESEAHVKHRGRESPPLTEITYRRNSQTDPEVRNQACLNCHQQKFGNGRHMNWQFSTHARNDVSCTSCHNIHNANDKVRDELTQTEVCFECHKEQRVQVNRPSHHPVMEGQMTCSSCHNVHGDNEAQLVRDGINETCYTCHMEKRGPFVHEHQPVTENCANCHNPHGTVVANLLKSRVPFLCQECHSMTESHPSQLAQLPSGAGNSSTNMGTVARGCTNCHSNIHGSNSTYNARTTGHFRR